MGRRAKVHRGWEGYQTSRRDLPYGARRGFVVLPLCAGFVEDSSGPDAQWPAGARSPAPLEDSSSDSEQEDSGNQTMTTVRTPKRTGGFLEAPFLQRAHAKPQEDRLAGDKYFRARRQLIWWDRVGALKVNGDGCRRAIPPPIARWPAYEVLH